MLVTAVMRAAVIIFIAIVLALCACFGPKHPRSGPGGTNVGPGSDQGGPWTGGASPALTDPSQR